MALWKPKSSDNYGTAMRSCASFGVAQVQLVGARFKRQASDVGKAWRHIPVLDGLDVLRVPHGCVPVAVEICPGAIDLPRYVHPERALYVFGPEDGSLPRSALDVCDHKIVIPGSSCLNLASAVTVVLYDRMAKDKAVMPLPNPMDTRRGAAR